MRFKPGQLVEWVGMLPMGVPWHFVGRYKCDRNGFAVIEMRNGTFMNVEKRKLKYADE